MNRIWGSMALVLVGWTLPGVAQESVAGDAPSVEARVWLDRGDDPVVERGDRVRVYYRTSADGYLAIFHIDTNGAVSLLFPASPEADHWVRGGRDYRLLFPRSSSWFVDEDPGVGYFFVLASPEPLDFREFRYSWAADGWDLSFVGRTVYDDPFVAMDEYIARLIPEWEYADYALDWVEYNVGERHDYPRFLCYDCHGFSPYSAWNPYLSACTSFRVVIYDDPWYYPVNRYRGRRVVYVRPPVWGQPRFVFKERGVGEPWGPVVRPRPSDGGLPGVPGSAAPRRSGAGIGSGGSVPPVSRPRAGTPGTVRLEPRTRPTRGTPVYTPRGQREGASRGTTNGQGVRSAPGVPSTRGSRPTTRSPSTRPSSGAVRGMPSTRPSSGGVRGLPPTRPSAGTGTRNSSGRGVEVIRPRSSSGGATSTRSGGIEVIRGRPSSDRSRSTGAAGRATTRSSPGSARLPSSARTPSRSLPSTTRSRAPTRGAPSTARSGGSSRSIPTTTRSRAPSRSSGVTRPRTPPRSSAGSSRPPVRAGTARKPPVRRKPGGGESR